VRESTERGDILFSEIGVGSCIVFGSSSFSLSYSVDLLVKFCSVVVATLTGSGDAPSNSGGMPCSNTSNFSITSVGFLLEMSDSPSGNDTFESVSLSHTKNIEGFILGEDVVDLDFFLEVAVSEVDLISNGFSSVDLDFKDVVLFLSEILEEIVLGVHDGSNYCGVFFDSVELDFNFLPIL